MHFDQIMMHLAMFTDEYVDDVSNNRCKAICEEARPALVTAVYTLFVPS